MKYRLSISYSFDCPDDTPLSEIVPKLEEMKNISTNLLDKNDEYENITSSSSITISEDVTFGLYTGNTNTYYYSPSAPLPHFRNIAN